MIAVGNDGQFRQLCGVLGTEALAADDRFATNAARVGNREELFDRLSQAIAGINRDALIAGLTAAGVPAGPINSVEGALQDPQTQARGMVVAPEGDTGLRTPIAFSRSTLHLDKGVPSLGATPLTDAAWSSR